MVSSRPTLDTSVPLRAPSLVPPGAELLILLAAILDSYHKTSIGPSLAHGVGLTRRERGFMRDTAHTSNQLRTFWVSGRVLQNGSSRTGIRTEAASALARGSPAAR